MIRFWLRKLSGLNWRLGRCADCGLSLWQRERTPGVWRPLFHAYCDARLRAADERSKAA